MMRILIRIIQVFVGVLFIVSGLVKANDPLGLSFKMQEFFELWNGSLSAGTFFLKQPLIALFDFLHDHSLVLSIFMITLEIVAGVALLTSWLKNFFLWLLLLLIVFFTFLTGYAYLSGKFTNCGCFGDCLPISPFTSFMKDVVLLVLITLLLMGRRYLKPAFSTAGNVALIVITLALTLGLQWYVLNHLPLADCLPFKKGNNIAVQMKPPAGSVPDSFAIRFIYEKGGKRYEFSPESLPADFNTYKFIDRKDQLVRKGNADPPIKGFSLTGYSGADSLPVILSMPKALLVVAQFPSQGNWMRELAPVISAAQQKNIPVGFVSSSLAEAEQKFRESGITGVQFFTTDFTIVRTIARSEPTMVFLKQGRVEEKFGSSDLKKAAAFVKGSSF
jgi:hypothetical protein